MTHTNKYPASLAGEIFDPATDGAHINSKTAGTFTGCLRNYLQNIFSLRAFN